MISFSSKYRSEQAEIMDNSNFQGKEMEFLLDDLKRVNSSLGGNKITIDGIKSLLKNHSNKEVVHIIDLGCGDGEMLRRCSDFGKQLGFTFKLTGYDTNEFILKEAENRSLSYPNIQFQKIDVFSKEIDFSKFHIGLCTLFLHHFKNEEIAILLEKLTTQLKLGVIVNDLERSRLSFVLFKVFSRLFLKTRTARNDGLISIARGFKKGELQNIMNRLETNYSLKWKWAFRYQLISKNK